MGEVRRERVGGVRRDRVGSERGGSEEQCFIQTMGALGSPPPPPSP